MPANPHNGHRYTLVLDLDETLIHFDQKHRHFKVRPYATRFLREMAKFFEVCIFTAALKDYADWIINHIDPDKSVAHRLYRDSTRQTKGIYLKDLSRLGRDLDRCIIIDNIEENFSAQPDNGIHIKSWYSDPHDRELDKLIPFLRQIVVQQTPDIRKSMRAYRTQAGKDCYEPWAQEQQNNLR